MDRETQEETRRQVEAFDWTDSEANHRRTRSQTARAHSENDSEDGRSPLVRDRDRIWHSTALRRLQGKTQIFASQWADPMRTRLTHTLEVMQIGRSIARNIALPEELVEAVCVAHDLGHPPFGHVGERALAEVMREHGGFDANAQTLRILTNLERKDPLFTGLNLTRSTLQSLVKYPFSPSGPAAEGPDDPDERQAVHLELRGDTLYATRDFVYRESIEELLADHDGARFIDWLYADTPVELLGVGARAERPPRTLACQVMDWADDAAYSVHDLEDGLHAGFIPVDEISTEEFTKLISDKVLAAVDKARSAPNDRKLTVEAVQSTLVDFKTNLRKTDGQDRAATVRRVTRRYLSDFITSVSVARNSEAEGAFGYSLIVPRTERLKAEVLKAIVIEYVLKDEHVAQYLYKGRAMLQRTFLELNDAPRLIDDTPHQLLPRSIRRELRGRDADPSALPRALADYLSGMTENGLTRLYQTLFESTGGSPLRA